MAVAARREYGKSTRRIQMRMLMLRVVQIATETNLADMLTITLGKAMFERAQGDGKNRAQSEPSQKTTRWMACTEDTKPTQPMDAHTH